MEEILELSLSFSFILLHLPRQNPVMAAVDSSNNSRNDSLWEPKLWGRTFLTIQWSRDSMKVRLNPIVFFFAFFLSSYHLAMDTLQLYEKPKKWAQGTEKYWGDRRAYDGDPVNFWAHPLSAYVYTCVDPILVSTSKALRTARMNRFPPRSWNYYSVAHLCNRSGLYCKTELTL